MIKLINNSACCHPLSRKSNQVYSALAAPGRIFCFNDTTLHDHGFHVRVYKKLVIPDRPCQLAFLPLNLSCSVTGLITVVCILFVQSHDTRQCRAFRPPIYCAHRGRFHLRGFQRWWLLGFPSHGASFYRARRLFTCRYTCLAQYVTLCHQRTTYLSHNTCPKLMMS